MTNQDSHITIIDGSEPNVEHQGGFEAATLPNDHLALKVWLRLFSCHSQLESEVRRRLLKETGLTLARFDYLAQLHRFNDKLTMGTLSKNLMVTNGNITRLTNELLNAGYIQRTSDCQDQRTQWIQLTHQGRQLFERAASAHETWIVNLMSDVPHEDQHHLYNLLGILRKQINAHIKDSS
jgi:DNA-binding MarR family transcriptional regulator